MFGKKSGSSSPAPGRASPPGQTQTTQQPKAFSARGRFGNTESRRTSGRIGGGTYIFEVEEMSWITSRNPQSKGNEMFVCNFTVLEVLASLNPETGFEPSNVAGQRVAHILNMDKNDETPWGVLKNLFLAVARTESPDLLESDLSPEDWDDALEEAVSPPGTKCKGVRLLVTASRIFTRTGNKPFTAISYGPYVDRA
jgi:hypothetical protein